MSEVQTIIDQLRRAFEKEAWHGPSVSGLLSDVTATQAVTRPLAAAHNIWEIVLHIAAWESVVRRRLAGEPVSDLPDEEDWPPVREASEAAWRKTLRDLERGHRQLQEAVESLHDDRLEEIVPGKGYSVYVMLHGVVQHDLYHAGQIAMLKKGSA
jgi:uncharacterized damage-inducible protein DinB